MNSYIFTSQRLGFRNWTLDDLETLAEINTDDDVMEFFPFKPSKEDTKAFIIRMQEMYTEKGFCYFAVDLLDNAELIGFIGLCEQTYLEKLNPFVDIGWRLKKSIWNKGYATEGAKACLDFGFNTIGLDKIYSVAPAINIKSELIMKKIGMQQIETFEHPKLLDNERLKCCVLYEREKGYILE
ncbi:GNAT family N-acetyltransferase [Aquimarina spinulae]|uniref:GNAT family N-acetyltransferase n=1 Tax=Aquimarina spinulae TaxID=1192023 RepID=UPI000D557442|nr:GNAT family N-acetyltransferase [Aquimarina spinulae]